MRLPRFTLPLLLTLWAAVPARSQMVFIDGLNLDLTKPADQKKVLVLNTDLYGTPQPFTATDQGLGWDGRQDRGPQEISVETAPLAIGLAWRTAYSVSINAKVSTLRPLPNWDGVTHLYLRYSPDYKHWSDWQDIHQTNSAGPPGMEQTFEGSPAVPAISRLPYDVLLQQHQRATHANDDEEGDVRWVLAGHPHFFEDCLPFMGYIQFLFEAEIEPGQRIRSIDIRYSWAVSGLTQQRKVRKGEKIDRRQTASDGPWHFKA